MARRERKISDLGALFASEVGNDRGGDINPFAMAMQLLGMQAQRKQSAEERGFEREKLAAAQGFEREKLTSEERRAADKLGLDTRQQVEAELSGAEARRLAGLQEQRAANTATAATEQQKFANQLAQQKLIADALEKVAGVPQLSPEAQAMVEQLPGMAEPLRRGRGQAELAKIDPMLRAAYGEAPDKREAAIAAVYGRMSPYARENAPWQDLNALIKPEVPRAPGATPTTVGTSLGSQFVSPEGVRIADLIAPKVTVDPELRSGRARTPQTPTPPQEEVPSMEDYARYGIENPTATVNRIESDPRYQSAEQDVLTALKNWWQKPPASGMTPSPEVYSGFPRPANPEASSGGGFNVGDLLSTIQERGSRPVDFIKPGPRFDMNDLLQRVLGERQKIHDATRME